MEIWFFIPLLLVLVFSIIFGAVVLIRETIEQGRIWESIFVIFTILAIVAAIIGAVVMG